MGEVRWGGGDVFWLGRMGKGWSWEGAAQALGHNAIVTMATATSIGNLERSGGGSQVPESGDIEN